MMMMRMMIMEIGLICSALSEIFSPSSSSSSAAIIYLKKNRFFVISFLLSLLLRDSGREQERDKVWATPPPPPPNNYGFKEGREEEEAVVKNEKVDKEYPENKCGDIYIFQFNMRRKDNKKKCFRNREQKTSGILEKLL